MTTKLVMGSGLSLPLEAATDKLAFLGRTGTGKTYAAQKLAEEMHRVGAQFVVLDPVGKWWSLRLAADGKKPGIPVPVFGGLQGDVPLEHTAGKLMADLVCDRGISVVLDVSQFEHDTHKNRFAKDFGDRLFFRKKAAPSALHLFLEEAQEFVPQNLSGDDDKQVQHVFTRLWKLGRNFGIGGSLITQRPQEVSKKVLNLTEVLFAFQLNGKHERIAVRNWIEDKAIDVDVEAILPKLQRGEPHVWSPVLLDISKTVKIGEKWTFDASSTPKVGARSVEVRPLAPIDLDRIRQDMAATIEKAKAEDPKELRRRIAELEREKRTAAPTALPKVERVEVKVPVLDPALLHRLEEASDRLLQAIGDSRDLYTEVRQTLDAARQIVQTRPALPTRPPPVARQSGRAATAPRTDRAGVDEILGKAERAILAVLANYPDGCGKNKLTLLSGYRYSGGFRNSLGALRGLGYITGGNNDVMRITDDGLDAIRGQYDPLPTGQALVDYWLNHRSLGKAERAILGVLVRQPGKDFTADDLTKETGYEYSGGFRNALGALRTAGLLTGSNTGLMQANEELFT